MKTGPTNKVVLPKGKAVSTTAQAKVPGGSPKMKSQSCCAAH